MRDRESFDLRLLLITLALLFFGTAMVLDASCARAFHSTMTRGDMFYYFKRHVIWLGLSLVVLAVCSRFPYWHLRRARFWLLGIAVSVVLLVLVLIIGKEINGSKRWIGVGPLTFQPSEFAKVALVVFLARYSELWKGRITHFTKGFLPPVAVIVIIGGLVAKEDLGTAITIIGTGLLMVFMMGARPRHFALLIGMALVGGVFLVWVEPYRINRITAWLDLLANPLGNHSGASYQPAQGLIALGSGGVWGQGVMRGVAKHLYLPAEHTDYILATVGEEFGLVGCLGVLGALAWLVIRGLTVAHRTRDWFGSLLAAGLTCLVGIQALLNVAVVTSVVPCTGVPLPFISYGGSSLVFTTMAVGIILSISQHPNEARNTAASGERRENRTDGWRHRRPHLSRS